MNAWTVYWLDDGWMDGWINARVSFSILALCHKGFEILKQIQDTYSKIKK